MRCREILCEVLHVGVIKKQIDERSNNGISKEKRLKVSYLG